MLKTNYTLRAVAHIVSSNVTKKSFSKSASAGANFRRSNAKKLSRERNG